MIAHFVVPYRSLSPENPPKSTLDDDVAMAVIDVDADTDASTNDRLVVDDDRRQVFSAKVPRIVHMHAGRHSNSKLTEKKSPTKSPQINVMKNFAAF